MVSRKGSLGERRLGRLPGLQRCEESGQGNPQSLCDTDEAEDREVAVAVLNLANIRRIQTRAGGECLLGESQLLPILADRRSKQWKQRGCVTGRHGGRTVMG